MIRIAIDWGSSTLRAFLFNLQGELEDTLSAPKGIKYVQQKNFEHTLRDALAHWIQPGDSVLLSGMITSRNGWLETDYLPCPVDLEQIASHGTHLALSDLNLIFMPGIKQQDPADVMRGEEVQLLGAASRLGTGIYITPGTHSKWVHIENNRLIKFTTLPTGEIFELICQHSLMGKLFTDDQQDQSAFIEGVIKGHGSDQLLNSLFSNRASILLGQRAADCGKQWLSGLLIGSEIREVSKNFDMELPVYLIGEPALCNQYREALTAIDINVREIVEDPSLQGFQKLIRVHN